MKSPFYSARLKIERAKEHINDLRERGQLFADVHPHKLSLKTDSDTGNDVLTIVPAQSLPDELLLILGDALHNLRSALDHAWIQTVITPSKHTKFPIHKTREGLVAAVNGLKENASKEVKGYIVNVVQPYEGGNGKILAGLNDLDIGDKHWLLIAHLQLTHISGLRAVDETGKNFTIDDWLIVPGKTASAILEGHSKCKITHKGNPRTHVIFGEGSCLQGFYILPTLQSMTNIVIQIVNRLEELRIESGR